jgi:LuxR family transcriptional regulator, maltose regulon positive regulatory protein
VTNVGWVTQAFFLEAMARDVLGDPAAAAGALEHALDLAEPDGLAFGFLLRPAPELLQRHARQHTAHAGLISQILSPLEGPEPGPAAREGTGPRGYGGTSQSGYGGTGPGGYGGTAQERYGETGSPPASGGIPGGRPPGATPPARLTEPLSHAEARVLLYLPTNLTVPEIADQLYLSVNTVRTHTRHIYDKLGAHRRHEAVDLARALGLLAPTTGIPRPRSAI